LGDPIRIKVARANLERKQLDFTLADDWPIARSLYYFAYEDMLKNIFSV
jgi:hypothetical protein